MQYTKEIEIGIESTYPYYRRKELDIVIIIKDISNMSTLVHVGTPPQESNCWSCTELRFHNFANLPNYGRERFCRSPNFEWILVLWPKGMDNSGSKTSVYLWFRGDDDRMPLLVVVI